MVPIFNWGWWKVTTPSPEFYKNAKAEPPHTIKVIYSRRKEHPWVIYSVHPSEEMRNQVTLGANIKYVLIKLHEEVENEASSSRATVNYRTKSSTDFFANSFSASQPGIFGTDKPVGETEGRTRPRDALAPSDLPSRNFPDRFYLWLIVIRSLLFWRQLTCNCSSVAVVIPLSVYWEVSYSALSGHK